MDQYQSIHEIVRILARLLIAGLCGNILALGFKSPGRKTQFVSIIMITIGAALYTVMQAEINGAKPFAVIIAISALAAAVLIQRRNFETALPLATTLWLSGGVGIAAGSGWYLIALVVTLTGAWLISLIKVETNS